MMNRRKLLKLIPAIAVVGLPLAVKAKKINVPTTVEELIQWCEENFDCKIGYQGRLADGRTEKTSYVTYALKAIPDFEEALVVAFYSTFEHLKEAGNLSLVWRHPFKISCKSYDGMLYMWARVYTTVAYNPAIRLEGTATKML